MNFFIFGFLIFSTQFFSFGPTVPPSPGPLLLVLFGETGMDLSSHCDVTFLILQKQAFMAFFHKQFKAGNCSKNVTWDFDWHTCVIWWHFRDPPLECHVLFEWFLTVYQNFGMYFSYIEYSSIWRSSSLESLGVTDVESGIEKWGFVKPLSRR